MLFQKYWHISDRPLPDILSNYAWIFCPAMDEPGHDIGAKRAGHREFLALERHILNVGKYGWVAGVGVDDPHVLRWTARIGGRPFELNIREDKIWFIKTLRKQGDTDNV